MELTRHSRHGIPTFSRVYPKKKGVLPFDSFFLTVAIRLITNKIRFLFFLSCFAILLIHSYLRQCSKVRVLSQTTVVSLLIDDVVALHLLALLDEAGNGQDEQGIDAFWGYNVSFPGACETMTLMGW